MTAENKLLKIILLLFVTGFSLGCQDTEQPEFEDLIPAWESAMDSLHIPGMVVVVVGPEGPRFATELGKRNIEEDLPVTLETQFYIASMTKPFVAQSIVQLAYQDSIVLNRPVRTYLPKFRLADFIESITITVRDLVAHRRGLQDYPITFGEAFTGQMNEERFYRLLTDVKAVGELDYSNLHYTLLGRVIESVTGLTWKDYVERNVLQPAGMNRSGTRAAPLTQDSNAAVPYTFVNGHYRKVRLKTDRIMHAAGGMLSTAGDLARWIQIHLNDGRLNGKEIYPREVIREMQVPQIFEDDNNPFIPDHKRIGWSLGWDIHEHRNKRLYYHGGAYEGWAANMSFMPEANTGVVVLINTGGAARVLRDMVAMEIYDRVLSLDQRDLIPELISRSGAFNEDEPMEIQSEQAGPSLPLDRYTGTYENEDWGTIEVWSERDSLKAKIGDLPLPLVWVGVDTLVADGDNNGRFEIDRNGRVTGLSLSELAADGLVRFVHQQR